MFGFGTGFVLTQFGLRWMLPWLGVAISIPTSTLLFWCLAPFFVDPSDGSLKAVILFGVCWIVVPRSGRASYPGQKTAPGIVANL
jgi:hypothetical protein